MARAKLTDGANDLISDSGAVLWSFIKGEQLEYPITLTFLESVTNYQFEAVVIEADNQEEQATKPAAIKVGGVQTKLNTRVSVDRGLWDAGEYYMHDHLVRYGGSYYTLLKSGSYKSALTPDVDPNWMLTTNNVVYLQFPSSLADTWAQRSTVGSPVYGFFELRVTEPAVGTFQRTWKPVRGMVQILFSPTDVVPD